MAAVIKLAYVVLAFMVVAAPYAAEGTLTYGQVAGKVGSCLGYLKGGDLNPDCCPGVKGLLAMAKTKDDRQAVCRCLKYAVQSVTGIKMANVVALPGKCDVTIPYKISPATDCATVK
ncbi:non-specific lipid-transfer protein 1-like [Papaver somniferum]|uniref:non-specific lipid-transfer protein 1-like n=1 Tax=Papaver somniferum TaxID=3469 RepID=UPI000E6FFE4A|nr:non-specific lipid-transfer protein 1-like [Papaver somniferum]